MSKFTKDQVIAERRLGLKHWDTAVQLRTRDDLFKDAAERFRGVCSYARRIESLSPFNDPWYTIENCMYVTVQETCQNMARMTWNLDEALTEEGLQRLGEYCGISDPYTPQERRARPKAKT